jgi:hypothetical protein
MPFKSPINATLTEAQNGALAKLSSVKTYLRAPENPFPKLAKEQQMSTFDFSIKAIDNLVGNNVSEIVLQQFLVKILDHVGPDKTVLEEMIVGALAKSLDARDKQIVSGQTNQAWLTENVLPKLTIAKRLLAKQIITMIFGPKELMSDDPQKQNMFLESSSCGEKLFSVTNNPSISEKELEFNRVKLRDQLNKGAVEIIVNCQKLEIKLPRNFEEQFNLQNSDTIGIPESQRPNPATSFVLLQQYVQNEASSQRTQEDSRNVRRGFFHLLIDKLLSSITVSLSVDPSFNEIFELINENLTKNGQEPESASSICSSPCAITNACSSGNEQEFKKMSSFTSGLINSLYALVVSMLVRKLINEAKKKIQELVVEKAKQKIQKLLEKQKSKFKFLDEAQNASSKVQQYNENLKNIKDIFDYLNNNGTNAAV